MDIGQKYLEPILKAFNDYVHVSIEDLSVITRRATVLKIPKKTKLLELGQVCNHMYFILSGCLR